jgi:hypothetical protein
MSPGWEAPISTTAISFSGERRKRVFMGSRDEKDKTKVRKEKSPSAIPISISSTGNGGADSVEL